MNDSVGGLGPARRLGPARQQVAAGVRHRGHEPAALREVPRGVEGHRVALRVIGGLRVPGRRRAGGLGHVRPAGLRVVRHRRGEAAAVGGLRDLALGVELRVGDQEGRVVPEVAGQAVQVGDAGGVARRGGRQRARHRLAHGAARAVVHVVGVEGAPAVGVGLGRDELRIVIGGRGGERERGPRAGRHHNTAVFIVVAVGGRVADVGHGRDQVGAGQVGRGHRGRDGRAGGHDVGSLAALAVVGHRLDAPGAVGALNEQVGVRPPVP